MLFLLENLLKRKFTKKKGDFFLSKDERRLRNKYNLFFHN